jgi:hypothetical protein
MLIFLASILFIVDRRSYTRLVRDVHPAQTAAAPA